MVARSSLKGDGVCGATGSGRRREYLVRVLLAATSEVVLVFVVDDDNIVEVDEEAEGS